MIARDDRLRSVAIEIAKRRPGLVAIVFFAIASMPLGATEREEPAIHDSIQYHDIAGNTEAELLAALRRVSYADPSGDRFAAANTRWRLRWNLSVQPGKGSCRLLSATAELDVEMNLPRWNAPDGARPDLVKRWDRFAAAVRKHEDGHRDIAIDAVREVADRLHNVTTGRDCAALRKSLGRIAEATVREYRKNEDSYDVTTMHGRAQGVAFP